MLRLNLLGPFQAQVAERPLTHFGTIRGQALLVYLAIEWERAHRREGLMALLWPDMPLKSAQQNLRQTIYLLRKQTQDARNEAALIAADRQRIQLNPDYPLWVDVRKFMNSIGTGTIAAQQKATTLYRGDFLADFYLPDSEAYEAWAAGRRAEYRRLALDTFNTLATHFLEVSDFREAEMTARRALLVDDLYEPAHQHLLTALAGMGRQQTAVAHYETFHRQLVEELDVEPNAATQKLAESIRQGKMPVKQIIVAEPTSKPARVAEVAGTDLSRSRNLPVATKPLIGREAELKQLDQFFALKGIRLVTIVGPGGMGKTRLSIEWVHRAGKSAGDRQASQTPYPDGRYFVDLAPITSSEQVAPAVAEALTFPLRGERHSPEKQLLDYLREKKLLLLMDNFEHILDAAEFVNDVLQSAPHVHILVTSRQRLNLSSEQVYALSGLSCPELAEEQDLESFGAVQLLLQSARRIRPGFKLFPEDREHVIGICRRSAGMPLAIELAVSWLDVMSLGEVAKGIEQNLDLLETELRDLPERHRSIRAAIDTSWNYLQAAERLMFTRLTIFQGGFSWDAAQTIAGDGSSVPAFRRALSRLVNKSLVHYDAQSERFSIHELLRQYGAEKLSGTAYPAQESAERYAPTGKLALAQEKHALHFADLLRACEPGLKGAAYVESLNRIEADLENILVAWRWLVENERLPELAAVMDSLAIFLESRGHFPTGRRNFEILVERWQERLARKGTAAGREAAGDLRLLAKGMAWQTAFELNQDTAEKLLKESLALLDDARLGESAGNCERAFAHYRLGKLMQESQLDRSIRHFEQGLALYRALEDDWGSGHCLQGLGYAQLFINTNKSRHYFDNAIRIFEKSGEVRGLAQTLGWLVVSIFLQDDVANVEEMNSRYQALIAGMGDAVVPEATLEMNAITCEAVGRYVEAVSYREQMIALFKKLGREVTIRQIYLGIDYLHINQYEIGREWLEGSLAKFHEAGAAYHDRMAFCLHVLAMLALVENEYEQAGILFEQAREIYQETNNHVDLAGAMVLTGVSLTYQGELQAARPYLLAGLQLATDYRGFIPLGEAFMGAALYLARQGELYQARAYFELAWRYPRFSKSALYDAIFAGEIKKLTAAIGVDDLEAIQQRSLELNPWREAAKLEKVLTALSQENK